MMEYITVETWSKLLLQVDYRLMDILGLVERVWYWQVMGVSGWVKRFNFLADNCSVILTKYNTFGDQFIDI